LNGLAPSSGGGTTTFLRADGTWAVPAGGSADGLGPDGDKGDITVGGTGTTLTIDANAVTDAKLRQSAGLSVIGRSTNTTGDVADIAAGTDGHVLRRSGTGLAFGTVVSAGIASGAVTLAKIQDINGHSVLGNATSSSGGVTAISASASDDLVLRRSGTTIGFGAINLASSNAVTGDLAFSNLAQGSALSVLGVTGNATADVASIAAGTDNQVLRRSGTALAFGAVNLASSDAVTGDLPFSNIAQIATSRFVGRVTASTGDIEALTGTQATTLLDAFTTSLKGVVPAGNSNKQYLRSDATWQDDIRAINFVIDGGGSTITTGIKGDIEIPFAGTIQGWTLLADQSGSIQLDLWKDTYANYPPVVGDTITASDKPLISSATKAQDLAPTGWTTTVAAGDIIRVNVDSITTCQRVTLSLRIKAD
jgi:hypothetical protein